MARISRIEKARLNDGVNPVETWFKGFSSDTQNKAADFKSRTGISFSLDMSGKMLGVLSLSTNCRYNARCIKNMTHPTWICAHCFAANTVDHYDALSVNTKANLDKLTDHVIPVDEWPTFNADDLGHMIRIESFGDVASAIQCINYMNLARANSDCTVTAWTKNPDIWNTAIGMERTNGRDLPSNMIIIQSSPVMNKVIKPVFDFIEKVFTVFDTPTDNGINCGERKCRNCKRCYTHGHDSVRELLK